jgi:predicted dehydrogenase
MSKLSHVRFGFIGAGQIAYSASEAVNRHEKATLVAIYDPNEERVNKLSGNLDAKPYSNLEAFLADDSLDAIYIATPNKFHAPLARQAIEAGKHVILEKPFAMNLAEAKEVVAVAEKNDRVFMVGMNQRFTADSQKIKTLVDSGTLGEVYHAKAYWRRRSGIPKFGTWFGSMEMAGGGCLNDIGVHVLDLCLYLIDNFEPVSVSGVKYTKFGNRGLGEGGWGMSEKSDITFDVDDFASALIKFKNGASVTLDATWACHQQAGSTENVEIFGTEAGATARPARLFRAGTNPESDYEVIDQVKADMPMPHCDRFHNFINHLTGDEALAVTTKQALAVQKILDAIAMSSDTGKEVVF